MIKSNFTWIKSVCSNSHSHTSGNFYLERLKLCDIVENILCIAPVQRVVNVGISRWIIVVILCREHDRGQKKVQTKSHGPVRMSNHHRWENYVTAGCERGRSTKKVSLLHYVLYSETRSIITIV